MPFVTIKFLEGRDDDQKKALVQEVTEVVSKNLKAPKENIHVFLEELSLPITEQAEYTSLINNSS